MGREIARVREMSEGIYMSQGGMSRRCLLMPLTTQFYWIAYLWFGIHGTALNWYFLIVFSVLNAHVTSVKLIKDDTHRSVLGPLLFTLYTVGLFLVKLFPHFRSVTTCMLMTPNYMCPSNPASSAKAFLFYKLLSVPLLIIWVPTYCAY